MPRREISVEALRHKDKRRNIPTAELEPVMDEKDKTPIRLAYERRNRDLDPQLVWHGKDEQDWSDRPGARRSTSRRRCIRRS
jgi:adenine-specific DNA-methyltransferase